MAKISTNAEINSIRLKEQGSDPTGTSSGYGQLYLKNDGVFLLNDVGEIIGPFGTSGGTGYVSGPGISENRSIAFFNGVTGNRITGTANAVFTESGGIVVFTNGSTAIAGSDIRSGRGISGINISDGIGIYGQGYFNSAGYFRQAGNITGSSPYPTFIVSRESTVIATGKYTDVILSVDDVYGTSSNYLMSVKYTGTYSFRNDIYGNVDIRNEYRVTGSMLALHGDVTGTYGSLTVMKLLGRSLDDVVPTHGQSLVYSTGTNSWTPTLITGTTAGEGGNAPIDATYITTRANVALSDEIVIPGLAGSADIAGAAGGNFADEYDTDATGLTWTSMPAIVDSNTTVKSHLYIQVTDNGEERLGYRSFTPGSGKFDVRAKVSIGPSYIYPIFSVFGLIIMNSDNTSRVLASIEYVGNPAVPMMSAFTYANNTFTNRNSGIRFAIPSTVYMRITRDNSNNFYWWSSADGNAWTLQQGAYNFNMTVARVGFRTWGPPMQLSIDWLRASTD